jgi:hypothetical protein
MTTTPAATVTGAAATLPPVVASVSAAALSVEELVELVLERTGEPIDAFAVAATLESEGLRDSDARERFGRADVFELAEDVWGACLQRVAERPPAPPAGPLVTHGEPPVRRFFRYYGRGVFFALPILLQVATVVAVRLDQSFTDAEATGVMIGSILSFVATGGFSQAIGRLGSTYTSRFAYHLAREVTLRLVRLGVVAAFAVGALWWLAALAFHPFPEEVALIGLGYHLVLSWLWLALTVLYMLERRLLVIGMVVVWLAVFAALAGVVGVPIEVAQIAGYAAAAAIATVVGRRELRRLVAQTSPLAEQERLPRTPVLVYMAAPYFVYGVLYFAMLFADRLVGWSAGPPASFLVYFDKTYELGLDWALASLVLTVAMLEYTIHEFSAIIQPVQRRFTAGSVQEHNRYFWRFYVRQLMLFAGIAVASGLITYWAVYWLHGLGSLPALEGFFASSDTLKVFFVAVVAYTLLGLGLLNALVLFFLSRPRAATRGLALGLAAAVVVGVVASRTFSHWTSAVGLLAGAAGFAVITGIAAVRVVRRMDYFYYSAY